MKNKEEILKELTQYYATEQYYKHKFGFLYTDGIKFLAESCDAYWLLDIVGVQQLDKKVRQEEFQVYHLIVTDDQTAKVVITDGNKNILGEQKTGFTDFPLDEIKIWLVNGYLILPSEY